MSKKTEDGNGDVIDEADCDEAFELSGHGCYNRLVLVTCSIISDAVALDMFGFSVVVAAARCDLGIGMRETGILAAAPFAGLLFAFPWGYFADTHGRRKALLLSTSVGFFFAAMTSLANDWRLMLVLKLIGVSFSTPAFTLTMAYLGECTGKKRRSQYLFIMNSMNLASEIVSFSLALFILPLNFNIPLPWLSLVYRSWRLYTFILAVPLGIGALMMSLLYESPKFLANVGRTDEALGIMERIYGMNGGKDEYPVKSLKRKDIREESFWQSIVKQTVPLFRPPLLWRTLQLFFLMAVCCATNNVFLMWFPTMVNIFFNSLSTSSNSDIAFCERINDITVVDVEVIETVMCDNTISLNAIYTGIILGVSLTILNLSVYKLATYRRLILICLLLIAGVSCLCVGLLRQPLASLLFFAFIQCTAVGIGNVASYFVDLYPTSHRGLATSLGVMVARLSSLAGVIAVGSLITDYCALVFYLWTILTLCGVGVTLLLPPDKKQNANT